MGASKRSNYTQRNSGVDVARNLGIVAGLGGLSFFLGFFVLARMVPDKETSLGAASKRLPSNAHSVQIAQKSALPAASEAAPPDSVPTRPKKPVDSSDSVVTIEPADEITAQKPRDIDQASKPLSSERERKAASSAGDAAETKEPKKEPEKSAGKKIRLIRLLLLGMSRLGR